MSMNKIKYQQRKEEGLCTRCGKPRDNEFLNCNACREYLKSSREMYKSMGVCPVCRKNVLFGDEKLCLDCKINSRGRMDKYLAKNRDEVNARQRIRSKEKILERKAKGICTRCGKRKATEGFFTCARCRTINSNYNRGREK